MGMAADRSLLRCQVEKDEVRCGKRVRCFLGQRVTRLGGHAGGEERSGSQMAMDTRYRSSLVLKRDRRSLGTVPDQMAPSVIRNLDFVETPSDQLSYYPTAQVQWAV